MITERQSSAMSDFIEGIQSWRLWLRFGWHDIVARYRRSWIGPFWIIATISVFIVSLSLVYSTLFKVDLSTYLPFIAVSIVIWNFISAVSGESVLTFAESEVYMKQSRRSPIVYVFRLVYRNVIVLANQGIVAILVLIAFNKISAPMAIVALFGFMLLIFQSIWVTIFIGVIGARFRDLQPIIMSVLQIFFLITPIIWPATLLGDRKWLADVNPFYHLIEIIRAPLLGQMPSKLSYAVVIATTMMGITLAFMIYSRFRNRIIYWL